MRKIGILVALLAALLLNGLTLTSPTPAGAEGGISHDASDDARKWYDVVKLRATNRERRIRIALHVDDLQERGRFELGVEWPGDGNFAFGFYVRVRHTDDGLATKFRRWKLSNDRDPFWRCGHNRADLVWRPARDRIILTVPHACLRYYDYYRVVNRWKFYGHGRGIVGGREKFDFMDSLLLDRG